MSQTIVVGVDGSQCSDVTVERAIEPAVGLGDTLVVVGTASERPLTGVILGSVPHKLVHRSSIPVLVVPVPDAA